MQSCVLKLIYLLCFISSLGLKFLCAASLDILCAIDEGDLRFVKRYISSREDVNAVDDKQRSLLQRAAARGHLAIVDLLLSKGAIANRGDEKGKTPLYEAVLGDHAEVAELLLERDAEVNETDYRQMSPLHIACHKGNVNCVNVLLSHEGVNVDLLNCKNQSALYIASINANRAFVEDSDNLESYEFIAGMLIAEGADVNITDSHQTSLLHWSVYNGHLKMVKMLINARVNVNCQRNDGTTPLMIACYLGHKKIAQVLLNARADIFMQANMDMGGGTAYQYARQEGHEELANHLQSLMHQYEAAQKQEELANAFLRIQQYADQVKRLEKKVVGFEKERLQYQQTVDNLNQRLDHLHVSSQQTSLNMKADQQALREALEKVQRIEATKTKEHKQFKQQQEKLQNLLQVHECNQRIEGEKRDIRAHEVTRLFYDTVYGKLQSLFDSYRLLEIGMVQRGTTNRLDKASQAISLLGDFVSLPFAAIVTEALSAGAGKMADRQHDKHIQFIVKHIRNPEIAMQQAELGARQLSLTYKPQIMRLSSQGAQDLAHCAVRRFMEFMEAKQIEEDLPLSIQVINSVSKFSSHQGFLGLRHHTIETDHKSKTPWTDKGVFQKTGILTETGTEYVPPLDDQSHLYGFRSGTDEQARKLDFQRIS